ncbi:tetratricopeptide repeat protein [Arenibaculum sp.]|uniref:tetratricopeptide repeat protein n=1 Tax=Arenibaculum sp. TaxID=2865862 RepID=UPI002E14C4AF|nr:tetratricopeptide repeat protein [Arenibaculum sp.]
MEDVSFWGVIAGAGGVLGVGALVAAYFSETVRELLPTPRRLVRRFRRRDLPPAPGLHFTVLVADLKRDGDGRQTDHVAGALDLYRGIDVIRIGPGPEWDFGSRAALELQARRLLEEKNGDVLIFGEVAKADERLRLRILGRHSGAKSGNGSYRLETAELPRDFDTDFAAALVAAMAGEIATVMGRRGTYLADILRPTVEKLSRLCEHMPTGLDTDQRGNLWHSLGLAAGVLGEQSGDDERLRQAIHAFRATFEEHTRERVPLAWAMTQNNLGNALACLGERESGTVRLEEAVAAFRAALDERTRERVPLDWAATQNNLGTALRCLGERESGTARLEEAVAAFRAALDERTRERVPLDWAMTQNNLGNALLRLGEGEGGTARLEEAVAAFRAALDERTRERVPLDWAATQNNLGDALRCLGEREGGTARLEEAVAAFRKALDVFAAADASHYASIASYNLRRTQATLDERHGASSSPTSS